MKKQLFYLLTLALTLVDCGKKDTPDIYATESFPQKVILVVENSSNPDFNKYLTGDASVVRRVDVEKTDEAVEALYNSSHAVGCVWIAHLAGNNLYFQLASDTSRYLIAVANRQNGDEYMLVTNTGKGFNGEHLFKRHIMGSENGTWITTIESLFYPKHYFSNEGVVTEGNAVRLNMQAEPENAVRIRWYSWII